MMRVFFLVTLMAIFAVSFLYYSSYVRCMCDTLYGPLSEQQQFESIESTIGNQSDKKYSFSSPRKRGRIKHIKKFRDSVPELVRLKSSNDSSNFFSAHVPELIHINENLKLRLIKSNLNRTSNMYFISELNYVHDDGRNNEAIKAISLTAEANPLSRIILVVSTKNETLLENYLYRHLQNISYDVYFCEEVLYGTLLELGNKYPGMKFAGSADDYYPTINFTCSWSIKENNIESRVVYALSRLDPPTKQTCSDMMNQGSFDSLLFNYVPESVLKNLRFSRSYFGCENVAAAAFIKESFHVFNLCPFYYPVHFHSAVGRPGRLRINHGVNSASPHTFKSTGICEFNYLPNFWFHVDLAFGHHEGHKGI